MKEKASPDNVQMTDLTPDELEIHHFPGAVEQVEKLMRNSMRDEKIWRRTALNDRVSAVRQLLAKVATVDIIDELADDLALTLSDARAQLNRLEKRMRTYTTLPGPTGESNTFTLSLVVALLCMLTRALHLTSGQSLLSPRLLQVIRLLPLHQTYSMKRH